MRELSEREMAKVDGGGWASWVGLYIGVAALAVTCAPVALGMGIAAAGFGAYDLLVS